MEWVFVLAVMILSSCKKEVEKPNILFIFTDDQQSNTIHALGNGQIHTPNIDKLVQKGVSFSNAYIMGGSSPAVCSPSRACLFSGRTLWNLDNQGIWGYEISDKYRTLPQVFKENGYITFATGKNEPGREGHFARSFNAGDKILFRGMTGSQYKLPLCPYSPSGDYSKENEVTHEGTHSAEVYANACIQFIESQAQGVQPFFAYVAFQTPHDPRQTPPEFAKMYDSSLMVLPPSFKAVHPFDNGMLKIRDEMLAGFPRTPGEVRKHLADYYSLISYTDAQIGRIMEALKNSGRLKNTIVVFASDNGLALGQHGLMGKQNVYDHSVHVPLIISGPDIPENEIRDQLCYIYDIYPTLCERAGLETPATVEFKSLNKIIEDANTGHRDHLYFAFMSWQRAVRNKQYKLIEYCVDNERHTQLFDLKADKFETTNLANDLNYAHILDSLRTILKRDKELLNDGNTPFEFTNEQGHYFWDMYESEIN